MAGAIIPNDWDGSTYQCYKVQWPSSEQWGAILLGQITEPTVEAYWEPASGNPADAVQAVLTSEAQTEPEFYVEDCNDMTEHTHPRGEVTSRILNLALPSAQALSDGIWQKVNFEVQTAFGAPHFWDDTNHKQVVTLTDYVGVWNYSGGVFVTSAPTTLSVGLYVNGSISHFTQATGQRGVYFRWNVFVLEDAEIEVRALAQGLSPSIQSEYWLSYLDINMLSEVYN